MQGFSRHEFAGGMVSYAVFAATGVSLRAAETKGAPIFRMGIVSDTHGPAIVAFDVGELPKGRKLRFEVFAMDCWENRSRPLAIEYRID